MSEKKKPDEKSSKPPVEIPPELMEQLAKLVVGQPDALFGPGGVLHQIKGQLMERMLREEMTQHLDYEPGADAAEITNNRRNGYTKKTVHTESGATTIAVPRDRNGTFEPQLVPKHRRRLEGFDEKVLALYARGMSTRDIQSHLKELYATDVSPELISRVTDGVIEEMQAWQARPLESIYPIVYLDALFVSVRENGQVQKRAIYLALGIALDGHREVLGLWMQAAEGARFWLSILTDLKNRGVQDIFFVCCDGLTGFPKAIEAAFPKAVVQTCIVHMIRASLRYVTWKDQRALVAALKEIYSAPDVAAAEAALQSFEQKFSAKHPMVVRLWRDRWSEVSPFFAYPAPIRKILYTTNAIESLNFQLRKVLKTKGHFPTDEAVLKLVYLALQRSKVRWRCAPDWSSCLGHFAIIFGDRLPA